MIIPMISKIAQFKGVKPIATSRDQVRVKYFGMDCELEFPEYETEVGMPSIPDVHVAPPPYEDACYRSSAQDVPQVIDDTLFDSDDECLNDLWLSTSSQELCHDVRLEEGFGVGRLQTEEPEIVVSNISRRKRTLEVSICSVVSGVVIFCLYLISKFYLLR